MVQKHRHAPTGAKGRPKRRRSGQRRATSPGPSGSPPAGLLVNGELHRFPWPAEPTQRYGLASPWLAVVNARGPWATWRHRRKGPPYIPLCVSLWSKSFWRGADDGLRVFVLSVWMQASQEDTWGIVWGDPVRLCHAWGLDPATFTVRLEAMLAAGLVVYLTEAERAAAMTWRPTRSEISNLRSQNSLGGEEGKPEGGGGEPGKRRERAESESESEYRDRAPQVSGEKARAKQVSGSTGSEAEAEAETESEARVTDRARKAEADRPEPAEPASLPKSDPRAVADRSKLLEPPRGHRCDARPGSVSSKPDVVLLGDLLAWQDPRAVAFARRMYEAIHGRRAPEDLQAAGNGDKSDVGVWVHYWFESVRTAIDAAAYRAFEDRCCTDVGKKRKARHIRNLGALARAKIVPGVLDAMVAGGTKKHPSATRNKA